MACGAGGGAAAANGEDDSVVLVPDMDAEEVPPHLAEQTAAPDQPMGLWLLMQERLASVPSAVMGLWLLMQERLASVPSAVEALQAPVIIGPLPRWTLLSLVGLGSLLVLQQSRNNIWLQRQSEAHTIWLQRQSEAHNIWLQQLALKMVDGAQQGARNMAESAERIVESAASVQQAGAISSAGLGMASLGMAGMVALPLLLSDRRLKRGLCRLPGTCGGCALYAWEWNEQATVQFGLRGASCGVLAQDMAAAHPSAVRIGSDGYLRVFYPALLARP